MTSRSGRASIEWERWVEQRQRQRQAQEAAQQRAEAERKAALRQQIDEAERRILSDPKTAKAVKQFYAKFGI